MSRTLFFYVARTYLLYLVAGLFTLLAVFLIADFGDRARVFVDHRPADVLVLYGYKALVVLGQLAPAGMLLAAGATVSTLRKRGEVTALYALSSGPSALYLPIALCGLGAAGGLMAFEEWAVTWAGAQVDRMSIDVFNSGWGDWNFYYRPHQWFRRGEHILRLRSGNVEDGFSDVTVLTLSPEFRLASRIDAHGLRHLDGTVWELTQVSERTFEPHGESHLAFDARREVDLGLPKRALRIRPGKPEQMRVWLLREQVRARSEVGLSARSLVLALHQRFSYPLTGFAACLLAVGLALRPNRRGHLTLALVEGLAVAVVLWSLMVAARALALSGHLAPPLAAWLPGAVLLVVASGLWLRREGRLSIRRGASDALQPRAS